MTWRSRADDFAQHDGSARAGDAGKISRQAVQGAVRKDSEGDGLFGVHRQAVTLGGFNRQMRQQFDQALHEQTIVRAAARDNQAVNLSPGKTKRARAPAIVRAVSSTEVRSKSSKRARPHPLLPSPTGEGNEGWGGK